MLAQKYGIQGLTLAPSSPAGQGASNGAVATPGVNMGKLSAENPMLWLLGIGAVTLGLIGASTSLRVGPVRASVSAGK